MSTDSDNVITGTQTEEVVVESIPGQQTEYTPNVGVTINIPGNKIHQRIVDKIYSNTLVPIFAALWWINWPPQKFVGKLG